MNRKPAVFRGLPGATVADEQRYQAVSKRRAALAKLSHDELLALYAQTVASRSTLSDRALVDLIIWLEDG